MTRRVLIVTPHFPPDPNAGAHRARLLVRHLPAFGWHPVVLAAEPGLGEPRDERLLQLVSPTLEIHRVNVWPAALTRRIGFGDLGLRAFAGLRREGTRLLRRGDVDAIFLTIYPTYPALLGPRWSRRFAVPFVLDYQDPWVGEWGLNVGPGVDGRPDARSRMSRRVAQALEPRALAAAAAVTAVSTPLRDELRAAVTVPCVTLPIGVDAEDFDIVRAAPQQNISFDAADGSIHVSYVGTVLPAGLTVIDALLDGVARLCDRAPAIARRLRLHFIGSSNQASATAAEVVLPRARVRGVGEYVTERPARVGYFDALTALVQSDVVLALGSTELRYTASKLYPALLANRPLLAVYRRGSDPAATMHRVSSRARRLVEIDERVDSDVLAGAIAEQLEALISEGGNSAPPLAADETDRWSARTIASRLAGVLDDVCASRVMERRRA